MYKTIGDIPKSVQEKIIAEYKEPNHSIKNMKKKYNMHRNEILAVVGQENALREDFSDGIIGSSNFVAIADTHLGSKYEKEWYYDVLFNYVINNNIRDIVHGGDFVQGFYPQTDPKYISPKIQLQHALETYPSDKTVTTHLLLGNHDLNLFEKSNKYMKILKSRTDLHVLGFKRAYMNWGKYLFSISHKTDGYRINPPDANVSFILSGHRHAFYIRRKHIFLPSMCLEMSNNIDGVPYPGFVIAKNEMDELNFYYYAFEEKLHKKRTEIEIKELKETRIPPQSYGKVLSLSKGDCEKNYGRNNINK